MIIQCRTLYVLKLVAFLYDDTELPESKQGLLIECVNKNSLLAS